MSDGLRTAGRLVALRRVLMLAYGAFLVVFVAHNGVPTGTALLMGMVMGGLAVATIGRGRGSVVRIVLDWLPFALVLIVYDISRSLVDVVGLPLHEGDVADLERHLFFGAIPTVWLQQHFYHPASVHWWDALATLVYASHFLATPIVAAVLWVRDRAVWFSYICRVIALAVAGLVTYTLFPEAPPWMAARDGLIDPVARLSSRGWVWLHMGQVDSLVSHAQHDGANPIAAMPSLHAAFAALIALFIGARMRSRWRWLLALYPLAMGLTLVYTGEHYVIDIVIGFAYAFAVDRLVGYWEASRAQRRRSAADEELVPVF